MSNIINEKNILSQNDLIWKPIYPNNMICNGIDGYYCLIIRKSNDGTISARKYSIKFQHKEIENGTGFVDSSTIDQFILFEKSYYNIVGDLDYPEPNNDHSLFNSEEKNTFSNYDINDCGNFVYAYKNIKDAQKRVITQYNAIYGYCMSFIDNH